MSSVRKKENGTSNRDEVREHHSHALAAGSLTIHPYPPVSLSLPALDAAVAAVTQEARRRERTDEK